MGMHERRCDKSNLLVGQFKIGFGPAWNSCDQSGKDSGKTCDMICKQKTLPAIFPNPPNGSYLVSDAYRPSSGNPNAKHESEIESSDKRWILDTRVVEPATSRVVPPYRTKSGSKVHFCLYYLLSAKERRSISQSGNTKYPIWRDLVISCGDRLGAGVFMALSSSAIAYAARTKIPRFRPSSTARGMSVFRGRNVGSLAHWRHSGGLSE